MYNKINSVLTFTITAVVLLTTGCSQTEEKSSGEITVSSQTTIPSTETKIKETSVSSENTDVIISEIISETTTGSTTVETSTTKEPRKIETKSTTTENDKKTDTIELINEYTTNYGDVNLITYPKFTFNYPSNWTVSEEEVTSDREIVTLTNNNGAKVVFSNFHFGKDFNFNTSNIEMLRVEVSKVDDSQFVPSYVQGTDYSSLGEFMIAELKTTGKFDMMIDTEFKDIETDVSYGVLPYSDQGTREDIRGPFDGIFSFWYSSYVSFIGQDTEGDFTNKEQQDVIAILNSFRLEQQ